MPPQCACDQWCACHHHAARYIAMAANVLGGAMNNQIGTKPQWLLHDWRGHGAIDDQARTDSFSAGGQRRNVDNLE